MSETTPRADEHAPTQDDAKQVNDDEQSKQPDAGTGDGGQQQDDEQDQNDSDLWAGIDEDHPVRKVVQDLRREAAEKRTQNKSLQDTIAALEDRTKEMKSPDEFQQAVAEARQEVQRANLAAARERVARQYSLPESLIPRLQGESAEELEADAKQLREDLGLDKHGGYPPKGPLRGGLDPSEQAPSDDEIIERIKNRGRNF